jgi:hypothetical protein
VNALVLDTEVEANPSVKLAAMEMANHGRIPFDSSHHLLSRLRAWLGRDSPDGEC